MVGGTQRGGAERCETEGLAASFLRGKFWTFLDAQARHHLSRAADRIIYHRYPSISSCDYDRPARLMQVILWPFQ